MRRHHKIKISSIWIGFVPFRWIGPRVDVSILDTTIFIGPLRIGWINP